MNLPGKSDSCLHTGEYYSSRRARGISRGQVCVCAHHCVTNTGRLGWLMIKADDFSFIYSALYTHVKLVYNLFDYF